MLKPDVREVDNKSINILTFIIFNHYYGWKSNLPSDLTMGYFFSVADKGRRFSWENIHRSEIHYISSIWNLKIVVSSTL